MLFDKNGLYLVDDSFNEDYDFAINILNGTGGMRPENKNQYTGSIKLYSLEEALTKGNAFPSLYDAYKGYKPAKLQVSNQREKALLEIQMLDFTINDLNLYLDLNPNDKYAYQLFKKYTMECKKKKDEYARIYGPLTIDNLTDDYEWSKGIWPWEEGMM